MPKVETIFRKDHLDLIKLKFKEDLDHERQSGNQNAYLAQKNLTEEEKFKRYQDEHQLPSGPKKGREYVDKIAEHDEIQSYYKTIISCVDSIKQPMENDCRKWKANTFV